MKVKSQSEVAQSCPTLSDPMDCSLPGSFVPGIFQARVLEWGAILTSPKIQDNITNKESGQRQYNQPSPYRTVFLNEHIDLFTPH